MLPTHADQKKTGEEERKIDISPTLVWVDARAADGQCKRVQLNNPIERQYLW